MLHHFTRSIAHIALPDKFTYPFHYTPHPLCVMAADEVQVYLQHQAQWQDELKQGKMFGVLIVQTTEGEIGYLAAFSGILAGKNIHPYFVPPIYDLLQPDGFFKKEEEHISAINHRIRELEEDTSYQKCRQALEEETARCSRLLSQAKAKLKAAKELRDCRRQTEQPSESEQAAMIRESQFQKAELKRLERSLKEHLSSLQKETDTYVSQICAASLRTPSIRFPQQAPANVPLLSYCNTPISTITALWLWQNFGGAIPQKRRYGITVTIIRLAKESANPSWVTCFKGWK